MCCCKRRNPKGEFGRIRSGAVQKSCMSCLTAGNCILFRRSRLAKSRYSWWKMTRGNIVGSAMTQKGFGVGSTAEKEAGTTKRKSSMS